ncbi:SMC-Scp complex subunit ScpB [Marinicauda salina]|uniref:SMC-Scp complex subunit ScpB n=1 Tax=Marinicauda salina TaxID=2135793 RepID=A0A2U2BT03_9PROT|nr:SMC-Scp complex subunit ScpB [Marinicauda salina]PWE17145.1 SMC-Scp complex subunit ScpB [Marinicauda salina]
MTEERDDDPIAAAIKGLRREAEKRPAGDAGPPGVRLAVDNAGEGARMVEALLFAASEPLDVETLSARLPADVDAAAILAGLQAKYEEAGVNLVEVGGKWRFQTAPDLAGLLEEHREEPRKLSNAATETLAIIAYHQPITRAEIEEIRGVAVSKGTIDTLFEQKWIRLRGRRRSPGRPVTYGTTEHFLEYFGLAAIGDLPGLGDLKAAGLLSSRLPAHFDIPDPARLDEAAEEDALSDEEAAAFHLDFFEEGEEGDA